MDESRKKTTEDDLSASLVGTITVRMHEKDIDAVAARVVKQIVGFLDRLLPSETGEGIRVLSVSEVARWLGKTRKELRGLESKGELPRRRRLSGRRVGYFAHEVDGLAAEVVQVRDRRTVNLRELSRKIGLDRRTIERMVEKGDLPPMIDGHCCWRESDVDEWLLRRPEVRD